MSRGRFPATLDPKFSPLVWFLGWALIFAVIFAFIVTLVVINEGNDPATRCMKAGGSWSHTVTNQKDSYGDPVYSDNCSKGGKS